MRQAEKRVNFRGHATRGSHWQEGLPGAERDHAAPAFPATIVRGVSGPLPSATEVR